MHARRLITTHQPRKPRIPDIWCHGFSRHLGRALTPAERSVISRLEQNRRSRPQPVMIIDRPGHDTTAILRSYLDYRLATSPPGATAILCTPSRPARIRRNKRLRHITYRQADHIRGTTPAFMMLLNAHQAKTYSPLLRDPHNFRRLCSALFPILDASGFLIIHIQAPAAPHHAPGIADCHAAPQPQPADPPPVTIITIPDMATLTRLLAALPPSDPSAPSGPSDPPHPL